MLLASSCTMTAEQSARADAAAARDEAKLDRQLAGLVPQKPTSCLEERSANVTVYGDKLLYSSGRRYWMNQPSEGCFASGRNSDDIIVTKSISGRLCAGDMVHTVSRSGGFPSGACTLGEFVPYTKPRG
jgi:hypothetical protein